MKKIFSLSLAVTLAITVFSGATAWASDGAAFTVSEVSTAAGDVNVCVEVIASNNPGVTGMTLYAEYDDEFLTLKEVTSGEVLSGLTYQRPKTYKDGCTLLWYGPEPDEIIDGEAFTMIFDVSENATPGIYPISLIYSTGADVNLNTVIFDVISGGITVPFEGLAEESSSNTSEEVSSNPFEENASEPSYDESSEISDNDSGTEKGSYEESSYYYEESDTEDYDSGWIKENNNWYYYADGVVKKGWLKENNIWYYLDAKTGVMKTGWVKDGNTWYFLKGSGAMATGWYKDNNTWYYLKSSGAMATGWVMDNGKWYFLNSSGTMKTGWLEDKGKWYYLNSSGAMVTNTVIDGYKIDAAGVWIN